MSLTNVPLILLILICLCFLFSLSSVLLCSVYTVLIFLCTLLIFQIYVVSKFHYQSVILLPKLLMKTLKTHYKLLSLEAFVANLSETQQLLLQHDS